MRAVRRTRVLLGVGVLTAVTALGACASSVPPPVPAGHGSPAAAASGFLQAASADRSALACSYVLPTQTSVCTQVFAAGKSGVSVKDLHLGATTVSGPRALVTALGTLCTDEGTRVCFDSTDRTAGQPNASLDFDDAYSSVETGASGSNDPAIPCTMVTGQWYVDLGEVGTAGSSPTSTSSTVP